MDEFDPTHRDYKVDLYPLAEIYLDEAFNCRGHIEALSVLSLANDIKAKGLDTPISLQPFDKIPGKKYRILAGHRRFTAFKVNGETHIPAFLVPIADDMEARNFNLRENLQRQDLTILQEAKALQAYWLNGWNIKRVGDAIGKSPGWVEVRKHLLELPTEVQEEAHKGNLTQAHIKNLYLIRNKPEKLFEAIRKIKTAVSNSEKVTIKNDVTIVDLIRVRRPAPQQINDLLNWFGMNYTNHIGDNLPARLASWVAGNISELDWWKSVKEDCEKRGIPFNPPDDVKKAINGDSN